MQRSALSEFPRVREGALLQGFPNRPVRDIEESLGGLMRRPPDPSVNRFDFKNHKSLLNRRLGLSGSQSSPSNAPNLFHNRSSRPRARANGCLLLLSLLRGNDGFNRVCNREARTAKMTRFEPVTSLVTPSTCSDKQGHFARKVIEPMKVRCKLCIVNCYVRMLLTSCDSSIATPNDTSPPIGTTVFSATVVEQTLCEFYTSLRCASFIAKSNYGVHSHGSVRRNVAGRDGHNH